MNDSYLENEKHLSILNKDQKIFANDVVSPLYSELLDLSKLNPHKKIIHWKDKANKKWKSLNWKEYLQKIDDYSEKLRLNGLRKGDRVLLTLENSIEWDLIEKACMKLGLILVACETNTNQNYLQNILQIVKIQALFIENEKLFDFLTHSQIDQLKFFSIKEKIAVPSLVFINEISWNNWRLQNTLENSKAPKVPYQNSEFLHKNPISAPNQIEAHLPAYLIFTSGTTGEPKGIIYDQIQILGAVKTMLKHEGGINSNQKIISWLPLANLFQRMTNWAGLFHNSEIFVWDSPTQIVQGLKMIRPSLFIGVPRFYEKLFTEIKRKEEQFKNSYKFLSVNLFHFFVIFFLRSLWSKNTYLLSGSSALKGEVYTFFKKYGYTIYEAYGLSECLLPIALSTPASNKPGSVGKTFQENDLVVEENGEIYVRGPYVFNNYYECSVESELRKIIEPLVHKEEKTHNSRVSDKVEFELGLESSVIKASDEIELDIKSFHKTGDSGFFDSDGYLFLKGRKSNEFKLSTGRKIHRTKIENSFGIFPLVDQFIVFGNGMKQIVSFVSMSENKIPSASWIDNLRDHLKSMNNKICSYENVKILLILNRPLSIEKTEITLNLKIKYNFLEKNLSPFFQYLFHKSEDPKFSDKNNLFEISSDDLLNSTSLISSNHFLSEFSLSENQTRMFGLFLN